jgi:hypothetical protein
VPIVTSPLSANSQTTAFGSDDVRHLPTISREGPPQAARTSNKAAQNANRIDKAYLDCIVIHYLFFRGNR